VWYFLSERGVNLGGLMKMSEILWESIRLLNGWLIIVWVFLWFVNFGIVWIVGIGDYRNFDDLDGYVIFM
jgi:hypothetical protein